MGVEMKNVDRGVWSGGPLASGASSPAVSGPLASVRCSKIGAL